MTTTAKIRLDKTAERVTVDKLSTEDSIFYQLMDQTAATEREDMLASVLHIGALAMLEDRIHHLIDATEKELFPKLERFKRLFESSKLSFEKTTQKGDVAEDDIVDKLNAYIAECGWTDEASKSGTTRGSLARNKTGDVLCVLELSEDHSEGTGRIAIEVKFDKKMKFGAPDRHDPLTGTPQTTGALKKSTTDTAWSQLLETRANRDCPFSLIVFDRHLSSPSITSAVRDVAYLPGVPGFVVIIDSQSGDYRNLFLTYGIARDLARYHSRGEGEIDAHLLELMVGRIVHFLSAASSINDKLHKHTKDTIKLNAEIHKEMARLLHQAEFTQLYLARFLEQKTLSAKDLTEFYFAAETNASWRVEEDAIKADIEAWTAECEG